VNAREFRERLQRRAKKAGITVSPEVVSRVEIYYRLLATWNQKINLTSLNLREASDESFDRLLVEPLVAARHAPAAP
jgi:16S rRNA G527 N7-methylase RsmG